MEMTNERMDNEDIIAKLKSPDSVQVNFNMDEDYQRCILALLLSDRQFLMESIDLIKPTYFSNGSHRTICDIVLAYYEEHKKVPNKILIKQGILDRIKDPVKALLCSGELNSIYDFYVPGLDAREALQNRVLRFAKSQAMRVAFHKTFDLLSKDFESQETWDKVYEVYKEAITVDKKWDLGLDYFNTLEERYSRMMEEVNNAERFTSAFTTIDNSLTGGGMRRGEIYGWIALSGVGKSLALVSAAVQNLAQGKKVLYISCEMSRDEIAERFDAQLANEAIWQLYDRKDAVISSIREHVKDMEDTRQLIIKDFPAGSADVNALRAYHSQLKMTGYVPDIVIIDYVGEMKDHPGMKTYESRFRIVRDLKGWAREELFLCLTAMQPNRSARELQEDVSKYIDDDNLADAFGQTRPLDGLWSINQGLKEKKAGVARGFVVKSRRGKSRIEFLMTCDERTLRMSEISKDTYIGKMSLITDVDVKQTGKFFKKKKKDENHEEDSGIDEE